jgi:hypothetical protein
MSGKIPYGEPTGIKLHETVVVSGAVTNREKIMYDVGGKKDVVEVQRTRKNYVTDRDDRQSRPITDSDGRKGCEVAGMW